MPTEPPQRRTRRWTACCSCTCASERRSAARLALVGLALRLLAEGPTSLCDIADAVSRGLESHKEAATRALLRVKRHSCFSRKAKVASEKPTSKDALEDEHLPTGDQMRQVISQPLDPLLRLLLPALDVDDLRDQHVIG
jgi:hypothetical protein